METTKTDLTTLGFRLLIDPVTPLLVVHKTLRQCYQAIACGDPAAPFGSDSVKASIRRFTRRSALTPCWPSNALQLSDSNAISAFGELDIFATSSYGKVPSRVQSAAA
jgi:hypothetical protein